MGLSAQRRLVAVADSMVPGVSDAVLFSRSSTRGALLVPFRTSSAGVEVSIGLTTWFIVGFVPDSRAPSRSPMAPSCLETSSARALNTLVRPFSSGFSDFQDGSIPSQFGVMRSILTKSTPTRSILTISTSHEINSHMINSFFSVNFMGELCVELWHRVAMFIVATQMLSKG